MSFTSFEFLIFFPLVVLIYNVLPQKWRKLFLLVASYVFYINMQPVYAILLAGVTTITYLFAKGINKAKTDEKKHRLEALGIVIVLVPLFFYKYFNFVNETIMTLLCSVGLHISLPTLELMLPVGISFYTFMSISYLVDVYNEEVDFEPDFFSTALYLSFFPIVLSGPIERAGNMFPQFKNLKRSTYKCLVAGFKLMLWGYFMKLCVADHLGTYLDAVYGNIVHHNGTTLAFAALLYPFRVYADFAGYSLIAMGAGRCMGISIMENFHRPFFATSVSDFWQRWHISLIKWLTDYIYTPLSFILRKWQIWGIMVALMVTFIVSGVWHGAAWTFIFWGIFNGVFLCIEALFQKQRTQVEKKYNLKSKWWYTLFCCLCVYLIFAFSQIFGRCDSIGQAFGVIGKIFTEKGSLFVDVRSLSCGIAFLMLLFLKDFSDEFLKGRLSLFNNSSTFIRWSSYFLFVIFILLFGAIDGGSFIYFQY